MSTRLHTRLKSAPKPSFTPVRSGLLQRRCVCGSVAGLNGECDECRGKQLSRQHRWSTNHDDSSTVLPIVRETLGSSGRPLDAKTRAFMEPRFGHDFSRVRVPADARAAESARAVSALAYTVGRDVVFGAGQYAPQTPQGQKLLAHELAHVIQQDNGVASGRGGLDVAKTADFTELEAERASRAVAARESFAVTSRGGLVVARQAPDAGVPTDAGVPAVVTADAGVSVPPSLTITRQGGNNQTFISTGSISLTVQVAGPANAGTLAGQASWTVHGVSANSGNGNPHTAANTSTFAFTPNPTNRPTTGSRVPNDPIQYRVEASVAGVTATFDLTQDESNIIRQEYVDLGPATPPTRAEIMSAAIPTFNTGNYSLIVDRGMNNAFTNTEAQFQTLTQQAAAPGAPPGAAPAPPGAPAAPPPAPPVAVPAISVTSGYRNPRRNVAAGSNFPVPSRHVWGSALDLGVAGANAVLWARLQQAGANAGNTSICERGATQVPCNDPTVDHVHIQ